MLEDRDIDRVIAGRPTEGADDLVDLVEGVRATYACEPGDELRERVLAAMAREVAGTDAPPLTRRRKRTMLPTRIALRLGATSAALVFGTAGLAVAGVDLPDAASGAFDRAGVTLPNQHENGPDDRGRSEEVQAIIDATPPSERDCAFGHRVAEAARGEALPEEARTACERGDERSAEGRARAEERRAEREQAETESSTGSEFGRETSERARQQRTATPEQRREFGREQSERARQLGQGQAPDNTPAGPPAGTQQGQPDDTPAGPPETTPRGKPEGTPGGAPEGAGRP